MTTVATSCEAIIVIIILVRMMETIPSQSTPTGESTRNRFVAATIVACMRTQCAANLRLVTSSKADTAHKSSIEHGEISRISQWSFSTSRHSMSFQQQIMILQHHHQCWGVQPGDRTMLCQALFFAHLEWMILSTVSTTTASQLP